MLLKKRASHYNLSKKRASQGFLDPIQKRALSRSVQLEAVYLEALLYDNLPSSVIHTKSHSTVVDAVFRLAGCLCSKKHCYDFCNFGALRHSHCP